MNIKRILTLTMSIAVIALMLLSGSMIVMTGHASSPSGTASFTFPYSYGTPKVPKNVGAQGIQGPNVPLSSIGVTNFSGPSGPYGTSSGTRNPFSIVPTSITIDVQNGTVTSHTSSIGTKVSLTNTSEGTFYSGLTASNGSITFAVSAGYYLLEVNDTVNNQYVNFSQMIFIKYGGMHITRYLLPSSDDTLSVNNGASTQTTANAFVRIRAGWSMSFNGNFPTKIGLMGLLSPPQIQVSLYNSSDSNALIGNAVTGSNGSAEFSNLNTAYTYEVVANSVDTLTGVNYYAQSGSWQFTVSAGNQQEYVNALSGNNTWSGKITGTTPSVSSWTLTANTTVENGSLVITSIGSQTGEYTLKLINSTLVFNDSINSASGVKFVIDNSSVVSLFSTPWMRSSDYIYVNYSYVVGSVLPNAIYYNGWSGLEINNTYFSHSVFATEGNWQYGSQPMIFNASHTEFENVTVCTPVKISFKNSTWSNGLLGISVPGISEGRPTVFSNDIITNVALYMSTLNFTINSDSFVNSTFYINDGISSSDLAHAHFLVTQTYLNLTEGSAASNDIGFFSNGNISIRNSIIRVMPPTSINDSNFNSYYTQNGYSVGLGYGSNISLSIVNLSSVPNVDLVFNANRLNVYDSVISKNATVSQIEQRNNISATVHPIVNTAVFNIYNVSVNYSILDMAAASYFHVYLNGYFTHDLTPFMYWLDYYQQWQLWGNSYYAKSIVVMANDSFIKSYYDNSGFKAFLLNTSGIPDPTNINEQSIFSETWFNDGNNGDSLTAPPATVIFNHITFDFAPVGGNNEASLIALWEGHATAVVENSLFMNDLSDNLGPSTPCGRLYNPGFSADIIAQGENITLTNNYFLNTNNHVIAISNGISNGISQNTDKATSQVSYANVTLKNNYIYFNPTFPGENQISTVINATMIGGATSAPTGWLNQSYLNYEIPVNDVSFVKFIPEQGSGDYIFNTSVLQTFHNASSSFWAYGIAPDVNTLSGTPVISYSNGLVAGPQPNFEWHGYNYSESVEPSYIKIGVNSSKAPNVTLQYNNLFKKTLYIAYIYTNGVIYKDWAFNSNSSSTYNVTYNPATMPLDPTIVVIPWTPTSPNPPPLTPIIVNAGNNILQFIEQPYVLIPLIILIVAAVALFSTGRRKY